VGKLKEILSIFKHIWNPPREKFLIRSLLAIAVVLVGLMGGITFWFVKASHPKPAVHAEVDEQEEGHGEEHAAEEGHGEAKEGGEGHGGGGEGGGHEGGGAVTIFKNPIPKEIRKRRDGVMEAGHDLVDPDIKTTRGLASILKEDLKVNKQYRFVNFPELMAGTSPQEAISGKVITKISLELDSYEGENEVRQRTIEFQGLISSLISERKRDTLKTFSGRASLKADIQREINHQLKKGRVTDVLLVDFFVM
jgi:flagellar basal body-associated protein FliL